MTLKLSEVRSKDHLVSRDPIAFDYGNSYVTGPTAVIRNCLYVICTRRGGFVWNETAKGKGVDVRDLQNATLSRQGIAGWERSIARAIRSVDFVNDAVARLLLDGTTWRVVVAISLIDGKTYPLEVTIGEAASAINKLGAG